MTDEQIKSHNIDLEMRTAEDEENEKIKLLLLGEFRILEFLYFFLFLLVFAFWGRVNFFILQRMSLLVTQCATHALNQLLSPALV